MGKKHFLRYGYEKTSLRDLCRDAGLTTGAFYRHFESKESLFSELVEPLAKQIEEKYHNIEKECFEYFKKGNSCISSGNYEYNTIIITKFLFQNREKFELLIRHSSGTKYNDYLSRLIELEDKKFYKMLNILGKDVSDVSESEKLSIHLLNYSYMHGISEIVLQSETEEEAVNSAKIVANFFSTGWKDLLA